MEKHSFTVSLVCLLVLALPSCYHARLHEPQTQDVIETTRVLQVANQVEVYISSKLPLEQCAGDCDTDSDCSEGLICFQHEPLQPVPGCLEGETNPTRTDFCVIGTAAASSMSQLRECQGDCDSDDDCAEGLICFDHDPFQAVPGCPGGETNPSRTDYCILDGTTVPSSSPSLSSQTPTITSTIQPSEYPSILPSSSPQIAPTKYPSFAPSLLSALPTTISSSLFYPSISTESSLTTFKFPTVTDLPSSSSSNNFKFPSVTDLPSSSSSTTNKPTTEVETVGPFQMKLYWTSTSCWQEQCKTHFQWCMQCEGHNCNVGDLLWIEPCREDLPSQQRFTWAPVPRHIRTAVSRSFDTWGLLQVENTLNTDQLLCLQRMPRKTIYQLQPCDFQQERQWFRGFDASGKAFELNPYSARDSCMTMPHHPRHYEQIHHATCRKARIDKSSQWQAIYWNQDRAANASEVEFEEEHYYRLGPPRRDPACLTTRTCGICQGQCRDDSQCVGSLKCSKRNGVQAIPNCYGTGVSGMDYCYADGDN